MLVKKIASRTCRGGPGLSCVPRRNFWFTQINRQREFEITEELLDKMKKAEELHEEMQDIQVMLGNKKKSLESPFVSRDSSNISSSTDILSNYLNGAKPEPKFSTFPEDEFHNSSSNLLSLDTITKVLEPLPKKDRVIILNTKLVYNFGRGKSPKPPKNQKIENNLLLFGGLDITNQKKLSFGSKTDAEEYFKAIELYKPMTSPLHTKQYNEIVANISKLFNKGQLKSYLAVHGASAGTSLYTIKRLANHILSKVWKVEKAEVVDNVRDLIREETIPLDVKSLKLLFSNSGIVIFNWRSLGADIAIDINQRLVIRASSSVIRYIRIMITNILDASRSVTFQVDGFRQIDNKPLLDYLSSITDVVYEKNGSTLSLYSLKEHRLVTFKQLLLLSLNTNSFTDSEIMTDFKGEKFAISDTLSISEIHNYLKWYRYQLDKQRKEVDGEVFEDIWDYDTINDEIKSLMIEQLALEPVMEEIILNLNEKNHEESVKVFKNEKVEEEEAKWLSSWQSDLTAELLPVEEGDIKNVVVPNDIIDVDVAYDKLERKQMVTASFGSLLVDEQGEHKIFNTHLPFINKRVSELPLYLKRISADKDNFDYLYVIKFIPNPYSDVSNIEKYPPIEFWFETAGRFIDVKSLKILQTNHEKNLLYSLPQYQSDLKITSASVDEIDTNLAGEWLHDQPGILEFLEDCSFSVIDFKESNMRDSCKINLGGKEIDYFVVGTQQRRQLELNFNDQLLQYNVVDNGHYGGKQLEVNLVGDLNGDMTRDQFNKLVSNLLQFVQSL